MYQIGLVAMGEETRRRRKMFLIGLVMTILVMDQDTVTLSTSD